jgi:hypothetical protein
MIIQLINCSLEIGTIERRISIDIDGLTSREIAMKMQEKLREYYPLAWPSLQVTGGNFQITTNAIKGQSKVRISY